MARNWCVVVFLMCVSVAVKGEDYCRFGGDHTMCRYKGVGPKCSPRLSGGVSETDREAIINAHNTFRQRVAQGQETRGAPGPQPSASNMRMMTWSNELAKVAQRWADQCDFKMDSCRSVSSLRSVSQAIYRSSVTGGVTSANWPAVVTKWSDHVKTFNKANLNAYIHAGNAGLYTQLVWAETHLVGCGYTAHKEQGDNEWTHQFYVCNYSPAGNMNTESVYKKGPACSRCPEGTFCKNSRFPALCA